MITKQLDTLLKEFPFLTLASCNKREYIGIIQNQDGNLISMYIYEDIKLPQLRQQFLTFGSEWWWETNRTIPINIILGEKFAVFRDSLRTFNLKEVEIIHGPTVCLRDIIKKRVKRKNIQLVRRVI